MGAVPSATSCAAICAARCAASCAAVCDQLEHGGGLSILITSFRFSFSMNRRILCPIHDILFDSPSSAGRGSLHHVAAAQEHFILICNCIDLHLVIDAAQGLLFK